MRRFLVLATSLALLLGGAEGALAQSSTGIDTTRVKDIVQPSVTFLVTDFAAPVRSNHPEASGPLFGGEPVTWSGRCTGFFVNPAGYVATAAHCIVPDDNIKNNIAIAAATELWERGGFFTEDTTLEEAQDIGLQYFETSGRVTADHYVAWPTTSPAVTRQAETRARRVGYRPFLMGDVGLLKFEAGNTDFPGLELGETPNVDVGTEIVAVGFPGSVDAVTDPNYNPSFTNGQITRIGTQGGNTVAVYQHDAAVSGGMSGGPVVDADGRVIGITSFGIDRETEAFNFATPVSLLAEVLGDKAVTAEVGGVGTTYREGVDALYSEEKSTAVDSFHEVQTHPGNPAGAIVNAGLLDRAEALPDDSGISPWIIALIVLLAIAAIIAVLAIIFSRRGRTPQARPVVAQPAYAGGGAVASSSAAPLAPGSPSPQVVAAPPRRPAPATQVVSGPKPMLIMLVPSGDPKKYELAGEMTIGREGVDILLPEDDEVSRKHATLRVVDGRVEIEDLKSSNGTEVNGKKIDSATVLHHGDTITVGGTELKVELPADSRGRSSPTTIKDAPSK